MRTVNLLPPEAALRTAARRKSFGLILLGVIYLALLAVGFLYVQGQADEVEARLARQEETN